MISTNRIDVDNGGEIDGIDRDDSGDCSGGGSSDITRSIAVVTVTEGSSDDLQGLPEFETWPGGYTEMLDSIGLRWDVLSDPNFPVEFENTLPNFAALPADFFPIIRYTGWVMANFTGRGVLIIDGMFDPGPSLEWDGIVLAADVDDIVQGHLDGSLVGGLDGPDTYSTIDYRLRSHYHSCDVYAANETLSYLEPIENTIFEGN